MEIYNPPGDSIAEASHRTMKRICAKLSGVDEGARVLDIGSGYAGTARHLARTYGGHVTGSSISEVENERHRRMNEEQGLKRLLLEDMASPGFSRGIAARSALREIEYEDLTPHLTTHYAKVLEDMETLVARDDNALAKAYVERARTGLRRWVEGGDKGHQVWGAFHFRW